MKYAVYQLVTIVFFCISFYSIQGSATNLVIAPVNDPALKDLLIRTMFVDKKKRIYMGTDSGLYRYANNNLVKLDNNFAITANAFNGAISRIQELDDRYLAINAFLSKVIYFDRVRDGYVEAPYGINKNHDFLTVKKITDSHWLWDSIFDLSVYSSSSQQYRTLLSTNKDERITNFKFNETNNSLYVMTQKGLYFTQHIDQPLRFIFSIERKYFSGAFFVDNIFHYLSDEKHLTFENGELVSQFNVRFCQNEQIKIINQKKFDHIYKVPYFYDISSNKVIAVSECGVYQYDLLSQQLNALILPQNNESTQWLKGMTHTKDLPLVLETSSGLFLIDKQANISKLRDKTSASLGGTTFSVVKVNEDQYLIADGTPGLKIASSRINNFNNLTQADLERLTEGHSLRDILKTNDNTLWLSSQTNGLFKVIKQQGIWQNAKQYLAKSHVRSLYKDNNTLWVATEGRGIHQISLIDDSIHEIDSPKDIKGFLSFFSLNNEELLVGSTHGVLVYSKKESLLIKKIDNIKGAVWAMTQDSNGNIWIGTHAANLGLFKLDSNFSILESYSYPDDLFNSAIMDIVLDEYEQPVLATWGGGLLYRKKDEKKFSQLSTNNGLLNNTVQSVIKLTNNEYWLSTEKGLVNVILCQSESCEHQVKTYTTDDGLSTNLFDLNSARLNEDGTLIYGGFFGLTWFDPNNDIIENHVIPAEHYVNSIIVDGKNIRNKIITNKNSLEQLDLNYDNQHINIIFNSDDYINQNNKKYRYKINDNEWTVHQEPEINLSALTHGNYLVEAGSSNSEGIWSQNNLKLLIVITPPVWLSHYAKLAYFSIFIFVVFILFKLRSAQLLKQNHLLEQKVEKKTLQLSKAIAEKEHMFESSSHELQTPLTLILNYLDLISKKELTIKSAEYISIIKSQSRRLQYLVKNMLLSEESTPPDDLILLTNMVPSISLLIEHHKIQADKKNISLITRVLSNKDALVNLVSDSEHIIFGNLIDNAIKYSPNDTNIKIDLDIKNNTFVFCISDQGPGFINLDKIGTKFYRESNITGGIGLGLANVKNWVMKNNGIIDIANGYKVGSITTVILPLCYNSLNEKHLTSVQRKEQEQENFTSTSAIISNTHKILFVEDDENLTILFKETLLTQFNIEFCSNGKQAIEYLQHKKDELPEVIISDVMMPIMNGFELCAQVKQSEDLKHIPFVLLTAKSDSSSQHKGLSIGADDYIYKPFEIRSLQLKIFNIIKTNCSRKEKLLEYITSNLQSTNEISNKSTPPESKFTKLIKQHLNKNIANSNYKVIDLAIANHMSESTLNRKLKQNFGLNFTSILKKVRMKRARVLLEQDIKIQKVVEKCGYSSHSYFNKHFKEEFGASPKEIKAKLETT